MAPIPKKPSEKAKHKGDLQHRIIHYSLDRTNSKPTNSASRKGGAVKKEGS